MVERIDCAYDGQGNLPVLQGQPSEVRATEEPRFAGVYLTPNIQHPTSSGGEHSAQ